MVEWVAPHQYLQEHAQAVALPRQLPLVGLRALEIEHVVDGDRDLPRHLLEERNLALGVLVRRAPPKAHHPAAAAPWSAAAGADRLHSVLSHVLQQGADGVSFSRSSRMKGCCVSHTHPEGVWPTWNSVPRRVLRGIWDSRMCKRMTLCAGSWRIRNQVLEVHDAVQPLGKFMEQLAEIAVLGNRFGHFQQRPMLRFRRSGGQFASGNIVHRLENNTPVRGGSTRR